MGTTKRRLKITLSAEAGALVTLIAKHDRVPEATKVSEMVNLSLPLEEEMAFATLGDVRLKEKKAKWLLHTDVWRK